MNFDPRKERKGPRYVRERKNYMAAHPLCAECQRHGIVKKSAELDHIIPVHKAPQRFYDKTNWQALCRDCHILKSMNEFRDRQEDGTDERLLKWRQNVMKFD